ncbi:MAG: hypothetical protein GYB67_10120 [Chloroflexi bacterium]|nr:hypothetical protein [Chloroflexota bacterium]
MEIPLTILYTYSLHGALDRLPRLYTLIRALRSKAAGRVLLFDLGASCSPVIWPCALTGGRSTLVALDGMGYDAANIVGSADDDARIKLGDNVRMILVDNDYPWRDGDLVATTPDATTAINPDEITLHIVLRPASTTRLDGPDGKRLFLAGVGGEQVGSVGLKLMNDCPPQLIDHAVHDLLPTTFPDPTISGIVEFVRAEARYAEKRRGAKS